MSQCPLTDLQAETIVAAMPTNFSTLDFICSCPYSGGTKSGAECSAVLARKSRSICGKRLSEFRQSAPRDFVRNGSGTPARWRKLEAGSSGRVTESEPIAPKAYLGKGWEPEMRQAQVRWKQDIAGVAEVDNHGGLARDYLFPEHRWQENLLPSHRASVVRHLTQFRIGRHQFVHHVMSSQAFALNLAAPYFDEPELLTLVIKTLLPPAISQLVDSVYRVEAEYDGETNYFNEPGARGVNRTSSDVALWWRDLEGESNLILVEVKFSEKEFGGCSKGRSVGSNCTSEGGNITAKSGAGCPLDAPPYDRTYWQFLDKTGLFRPDAFAEVTCCPFYSDGYQLMRNQLLAAIIENDPTREERRADFAVLYHDGNPSILHPNDFPNAMCGQT